MKTIALFYACLLSLAAPLMPVATIGTTTMLVTGCAQLSPRAKVAATLESTQIAVTEAMNLYGSAFRAGKVSSPTRRTIRAIHADYKVAFDAAVTAAEFNYKAVTPDSVLKLKNDLLAIIITL